MIVDLTGFKVVGEANGIHDGAGTRFAVADHAGSLDAEQRRTAIFGIIDLLAKPLQSRSGQQIAESRQKLAGEFGLEHLAQCIRQPFGDLEDHVADKAVANHDVN